MPVRADVEGYRLFWANLEGLLEKCGLDIRVYRAKNRTLALAWSKKRLTMAPTGDADIIQRIRILEDLQRVINLLSSRLSSVLGAYGIDVGFDVDEGDPLSLLKISSRSGMGPIPGLSEQLREILNYQSELESEVTDLMSNAAPNIQGLLGPLLGARLIAVSRGLVNLARMPGSRIQVLGAERAVFRHLRKKGLPPKHGLIFQHPSISKSPWWQRGKIARALGAKLAIAARLDVYSNVDRSEEIKNAFLRRYEDIKKTYPKEPERLRIIRNKPALHRKRRR